MDQMSQRGFTLVEVLASSLVVSLALGASAVSYTNWMRQKARADADFSLEEARHLVVAHLKSEKAWTKTTEDSGNSFSCIQSKACLPGQDQKFNLRLRDGAGNLVLSADERDFYDFGLISCRDKDEKKCPFEVGLQWEPTAPFQNSVAQVKVTGRIVDRRGAGGSTLTFDFMKLWQPPAALPELPKEDEEPRPQEPLKDFACNAEALAYGDGGLYVVGRCMQFYDYVYGGWVIPMINTRGYNRLEKINPDTGEVLWSLDPSYTYYDTDLANGGPHYTGTPLGGGGETKEMIYHQNSLYLNSLYSVEKLSAHTGQREWASPLTPANFARDFFVNDQGLGLASSFISGPDQSNFYLYDHGGHLLYNSGNLLPSTLRMINAIAGDSSDIYLLGSQHFPTYNRGWGAEKRSLASLGSLTQLSLGGSNYAPGTDEVGIIEAVIDEPNNRMYVLNRPTLSGRCMSLEERSLTTLSLISQYSFSNCWSYNFKKPALSLSGGVLFVLQDGDYYDYSKPGKLLAFDTSKNLGAPGSLLANYETECVGSYTRGIASAADKRVFVSCQYGYKEWETHPSGGVVRTKWYIEAFKLEGNTFKSEWKIQELNPTPDEM